jgi:hypothetical protein
MLHIVNKSMIGTMLEEKAVLEEHREEAGMAPKADRYSVSEDDHRSFSIVFFEEDSWAALETGMKFDQSLVQPATTPPPTKILSTLSKKYLIQLCKKGGIQISTVNKTSMMDALMSLWVDVCKGKEPKKEEVTEQPISKTELITRVNNDLKLKGFITVNDKQVKVNIKHSNEVLCQALGIPYVPYKLGKKTSKASSSSTPNPATGAVAKDDEDEDEDEEEEEEN